MTWSVATWDQDCDFLGRISTLDRFICLFFIEIQLCLLTESGRSGRPEKKELPPSKVLCLVYFLSTPAYARLLRKCFWSTWQQSSSICHSVFSVKVASLIIPFSEGEAGSFGQHVLRGEAHSPSQTGQTACSPSCRVQRRLILFKEKTFGCSQNPRTPESNFPRLKARRSGHRRYFRLGGQPPTVAAAGKPPQAQH